MNIAPSAIASVTINQSNSAAGTIVVDETGGTVLTFNYSGNLSGDQFAAPVTDGNTGTDLVLQAVPNYTFITDFTKNNDIQTELIREFPTGIFTANNSFATPFDITPNGNGNNFYDGFTHGSALTINVAIPDATNVYTLMNAYAPLSSDQIATVEFIGSEGTTETFTLVAGNQIRDYYEGVYANSINGTTTQNAFTVNGVTDGPPGNEGFGTFHIDEQDFTLSSAFASQTLVQIVITDLGNQRGGTDVPILLGATAQSADPSVHWISSSNGDWSDTADWNTGVTPDSGVDAIVDASGAYTLTITGADAANSLTITSAGAGADVQDEGGGSLNTRRLAYHRRRLVQPYRRQLVGIFDLRGERRLFHR